MNIRTLYIENGISYADTQNYIRETLINMFPEIEFYCYYDIDYDTFQIMIMEITTLRDEYGRFTKDIIKKFNFENMSFCDPYEILDEVAQWCEDYLHPKPKQEPIVEIVEKIITPHHCECCGAPMPKGTTKCEYCGTEYY